MISIQNLSFQYKKGKPLLSEVDLDLQKGKIYGLFGLNGVGKTTLLNNIAGTLFPKSGTCFLDGENTRFRNPEVMNRLFIVPEQFDLPKLTGEKYIELYQLFYPNFDMEVMSQVLDGFDIDASKKLPELSYGQRKKFLIAFAISTQAELLIFDEPTNGLDIPSKSQFRKIVSSLDVEARCILISTHQVRDLGAMIDHVIVLKNERIVFNQNLDNISQHLSIKKIEQGSSVSYIYGEEMLGGIHAIIPSAQNEGSKMDLELLFNGIIQKTEEINKQFEVKS